MFFFQAEDGIRDFCLSRGFGFFFFKQKTAYEISACLVGSEMCIRDRGKDDLLAPWHVTDNLDRLDLTFTPILDRAAYTGAVVLESNQHQVFGRFDGTAVLDDGTALTIRGLRGFAEKVKNRW